MYGNGQDGIGSAHDPVLTPVLGEVLSNLVPLRYKWSATVCKQTARVICRLYPPASFLSCGKFYKLLVDNALPLVVEWTVHYCGVVCEFDCIQIEKTVIDS